MHLNFRMIFGQKSLFFKNNFKRNNHCKFIHHKSYLKPLPFLSFLPCIVHREYFSIIFNVKKCALYSIKYGKCCEYNNRGQILGCLWMSYEWARHELWTRLAWMFLVFLVICEWTRHDLKMRWAWTLWDNNLSLWPTKNSTTTFVYKWGQARNELQTT